MSTLREPRFEIRRRTDLRDELLARAKAWMPGWRPLDYTSDFAGALLEIVARLESEVAQRLDKMPEKMFRDFLTWLGVRGEAAQAALLPLVFNLSANSASILAQAPVQVQGSPPPSTTGASPEPITFETEEDVMIVPGTLAALYAVDPAADAFYCAPDGFSSLDPPKPGPTSWTVTTLAPANSTQIQLDPPLGLDALPTLVHQPTNLMYRVTKAQGGLVTVDPPVGVGDSVFGTTPTTPQDLAAGEILTLVTTFDPFGPAHRNLQEHDLYIGSESLLNLATAAKIGIQGLAGDNINWYYWGKDSGGAGPDWQGLQPDTTQKILTLNKDVGSVEITQIEGKSSRWLKGTVAPQAPATTQVSNIQLVVNSQGCGQNVQCPPDAPSQVQIAGIANATPLVLDTPFYPLGREPRLFDAFYLGCPEAFSKPKASVKICFEAQDATSASFTAAQVTATNTAIRFFGVGRDGFLHHTQPTTDPTAPVKRLPAVQPPVDQTGKPSVNAAPAPLAKGQGRLSTLTRANDVLVAVTSKSGIWIWSENQVPDQPGTWYFLDQPSGGSTSAAPPATPFDPSAILMSDGANIHVVAVTSDGILYEADLAPGWELAGPAIWSQVSNTDQSWWAGIAPVIDPATQYEGTAFANGWIGVSQTGKTSLFTNNAGQSLRTKALPNIDPLVNPLALLTGAPGSPFLFVGKTGASRLDAWTVSYDLTHTAPITHVTATVQGNSFDWANSAANGIAVLFTNQTPTGSVCLAAWFPQSAGVADPSVVYMSQPIAGLSGAPAATSSSMIAPGAAGAIIAVAFNVDGLVDVPIPEVKLATALVVQNAPDYPKKHDLVVVKPQRGHGTTRLNGDAKQVGSGSEYWIPVPDSEMSVGLHDVTVYRDLSANPFTGDVAHNKPKVIRVDPHDHHPRQVGDPLHVTLGGVHSFHTIQNIQTTVMGTLLTVKPRILGVAKPGSPVDYNYLTKVNLGTPALLPLIDGVLTDTQASQISTAGTYFLGGQPSPNLMSFQDGTTPNISAVLQSPWMPVPTLVAAAFHLIINGLFTQLVILADNKTTNPSLSWEYFDGQAWRIIPNLDDKTSSLRSTGVVSFCVPVGLQSTDVAGQNSFWIRARLVGGDYGQETVTVQSSTDPTTGVTTQTVIRSLSSVSPPVLASVNLSYSLCCAANPDYIITSDGGETRDQTAANTASAAQIALFPLLGDSIGQTVSAPPNYDGKTDRAIYLGFDGEFSGGPINVLFFVQDQNFGDDAFPLRVEVLRETGFEHIVSEDNTRALGETGILSFFLESPPPAMSLFGVGELLGEDLRWLRLRPNARFSGSIPWTPQIRLAYVNGVFSRASETQTLERLGSSDGSPQQTVTLARPPVLPETLELRVQEPLGDEDVQSLRATDPNSVLDNLPTGQAGPWVLWKEIPLLAEAGKTDRSYSLDNDTGDITFGDGNHGLIPPIGADSIVAITYKHGGGAAANNITAWGEINLVSPVQGVERVVAPDDAAGGSDPQTADEVIRYAPANQFIRDRALSLPDFETLAVESSRDIVQARAFSSGGGVRLIAVTRAQARKPSQAQWRALLSYLADRTSPSLAVPNAITPVDPRLVDIGIQLTLTIRSIEFSGDVDQEASKRIVNLLDPETGGLDGQGWPLGFLPTETDIAAVLIDVPNLEAVESATITATVNGAAVQKARPEDVPVVSPESIHTQFEIVDVEVGA